MSLLLGSYAGLIFDKNIFIINKNNKLGIFEFKQNKYKYIFVIFSIEISKYIEYIFFLENF